MKYRVLALFPWACAALVALAAEWLPSWCWHAGLALAYATASAGCVAAALRFGRRDRLRWAWLLMGLSYGIGFGCRLAIGGDTGVPQMSPLVGALWSFLMLLMNVAGVASLVVFARVWSGTGLAPAWRVRSTVLLLALGLFVDGRAALDAVVAAAHGDRQSLGLFISAVSDIASIALIGPVLATALAMRGGLLAWPWALQLVCCFFWLVDDATVFLPGRWEARGDLVCRMLGTQYGLAAALAQRWVAASLDDAGDEP
jgi:hypothetical protein